MAKKKTSRRRKGFTIPIAVAAPLALNGVDLFKYATNANYGPSDALNRVVTWYTGYSIADADWKWDRMKIGLFPLMGGVIAHKVATKLGINRAIASTGIPWVRI